jgi:hypothetical protein
MTMSTNSRNVLCFVWLLLLLWMSITSLTIIPIHAQEVAQDGSSSSSNTIDGLYSCDDPNDPNNLIPCDVDTLLWDLDALQPGSSPDTSQVCFELIQILGDAQQQQQQNDATDDNEEDDTNDDSMMTLFDDILSSVVVDALEPCVLWAMEYGDLRQDDDNKDSASGQQGDQDDEVMDGGKQHKSLYV